VPSSAVIALDTTDTEAFLAVAPKRLSKPSTLAKTTLV
jgi:hypothetical protein